MHPRKNDNAEGSGEVNRPLPTQLAASLRPEARQALMHGVRRRILRILNQDSVPQTTQDLVKAFPGLSLSSVNYHVLVLEKCGNLDDPQLVAALRVTESLDDGR